MVIFITKISIIINHIANTSERNFLICRRLYIDSVEEQQNSTSTLVVKRPLVDFLTKYFY